MAKGTRLGKFINGTPSLPKHSTQLAKNAVTVVSQQGKERALERPLSFEKIEHSAILMSKISKLRIAGARRKTPNSIKRFKTQLQEFAAYTEYYERSFHRAITCVADIEFSFAEAAVNFYEFQPQRVTKLRSFNYILGVLGVSRKLIPPVPWDEEIPPPKSLIANETVKRAMKMARSEMRVILKRADETETLSQIGYDPRRASGAAFGSWKKPECRYWIMENVFNFEARLFDDWRFKHGLNSELRGLERNPGAEYVDDDGTIRRHEGWLGHLRWKLPFVSDMRPFLIAILLRATVNASALATIRVNKKWAVPCPVQLSQNRAVPYVYIICEKVRGRKNGKKRPKPIRFISGASQWSHPYQLLKFIEHWTLPLRKEILRQIGELAALKAPSVEQVDELNNLIEIKDDLFIYKTEQQITSFAKETNSGKFHRSLTATLKRYRLPTDIRMLRDVGLAHTQRNGTNLMLLQIVAQHSRNKTAALYARRQELEERRDKMSIACFDSSIELIRNKRFTKQNLREALTDQGFNSLQVENLLDPESRTRYGNGCAAPKDPPKGFAFGTIPGELCQQQDCLDGCPHARWFREALPTLIGELRLAEEEHKQAALESRLTSTVQARIRRLNSLIGRWPKKDVDRAFEKHRLVIE